MTATLVDAAIQALETGDPAAKTQKVQEFSLAWRKGDIKQVGSGNPPIRPARPDRPELRLPRHMPKRRRAGSETGRVALLHALAAASVATAVPLLLL